MLMHRLDYSKFISSADLFAHSDQFSFCVDAFIAHFGILILKLTVQYFDTLIMFLVSSFKLENSTPELSLLGTHITTDKYKCTYMNKIFASFLEKINL